MSERLTPPLPPKGVRWLNHDTNPPTLMEWDGERDVPVYIVGKCDCVGQFGPNPDCGACGGDGTVGRAALTSG